MRAVLFFLAIGTLWAQSKPVPRDRSDDSYAVYSALLKTPRLSHPNSNRKYLIEDITTEANVIESTPRTCVHVPPAYAAQFEEVLGEYDQLKGERFRLERKFAVDRPYDLMTEAEAKEFMLVRSGRQTPDPEKTRGATDLLSFGNVYFDNSRTIALVRTGDWCGGLCGEWM